MGGVTLKRSSTCAKLFFVFREIPSQVRECDTMWNKGLHYTKTRRRVSPNLWGVQQSVIISNEGIQTPLVLSWAR